jgi:hypothetical protein
LFTYRVALGVLFLDVQKAQSFTIVAFNMEVTRPAKWKDVPPKQNDTVFVGPMGVVRFVSTLDVSKCPLKGDFVGLMGGETDVE